MGKSIIHKKKWDEKSQQKYEFKNIFEERKKRKLEKS